jgi:two-component system, NarL family, sensor histidine kinase UhpB
VIAILHAVLGRVLAPLTGLADGLRDLEIRNYRVRLARPDIREFAEITDRFNALGAALDAARADNLDLSRRLITAQDDERRHTALELHDEVGPSLFGLKANAGSLAHAAAALPEPAATDIAARIRDILAIIDHLQSINRSMLGRLRPMALGHVPLGELIAELMRDRARSQAAISFSHRIDHLRPSYGEPIDLTIYRCVQESLTNAIRHGRPNQITVTISDSRGTADPAAAPDEATSVMVAIADDGVGLAPGARKGFGLHGMEERVQALGGTFDVDSTPGHGTTVRIAIPISRRGLDRPPAG